MLDNRYEVTRCGKVSREGVLLSTHLSVKGYVMVNVIWKGKRKLMRVHRLVAYTYLPNPNNLPMVNHKDEDKSNNNDWNLEWCDNQYNAEYSLAKNFIFINPEGEEVKVFNLNKFCRDNSLPLTTMARLHKKGGKARNGWSAKEVIYRC